MPACLRHGTPLECGTSTPFPLAAPAIRMHAFSRALVHARYERLSARARILDMHIYGQLQARCETVAV